MVSQALDRLSTPLARFLDVSPQDISETFGMEFLSLAIEVPSNFLLTITGRLIENLILGTVFCGLTAFPRIDGRSKKDLLELASHFFNDAADEVTDPAKMTQFLNEVQALKSGTKAGDLALVSSTFLRTPGAIRSWIDQVSLSIRSLAGQPVVTVTPPAASPQVIREENKTVYRRLE